VYCRYIFFDDILYCNRPKKKKTKLVCKDLEVPQNVVGTRTFTYYRRGDDKTAESECEEIEFS
jgi:hypothetical protein